MNIILSEKGNRNSLSRFEIHSMLGSVFSDKSLLRGPVVFPL